MKLYKKMIAALAVSSMMLASMEPVWTVAVAAPASKETKEQKEKTIADLDANLFNPLYQAGCSDSGSRDQYEQKSKHDENYACQGRHELTVYRFRKYFLIL
ncbi:hypothetical protein M3650_20920 [Paenibacillus sp. MER TA 81-3]|uniref:hypothetical protein n=1 Tax=Paenibacillus sp. MER TA 81-3 TaxID=2939573 RepID=UPI00203D9897|nr:hypothetical protein [Paenibacillus sp. MER TA 81-3]MCM3341026.1 hypothetical protein [Paenibacillus sp. MER TA 81-3]